MAGTVIPYDRALPEVPGRSPYTKPDAYLEKLDEGRYAVRYGRRPSTMFLIERLRKSVDTWRQDGYPGISPTTRRLFRFWFEDDHLLPDGSLWRYWWCQREAVETLVYLTEVRGFTDVASGVEAFGAVAQHGMLTFLPEIRTTMDGQRLLSRWIPEVGKQAEQPLPDEGMLRYAFKMATGSGKTVVMAMLIVWSYLNRRLGQDAGFADNFLIVAPNVIVFERLERDFAANKIFYELPLIPSEWRGQWGVKVILRGDSTVPDPSGNLFVVNIQQIYESREEDAWTPANAIDAILGREPKQELAAYEPSMLERIKGLNSLMVLNDEAHHVHDDELAWNQTLLALNDNLKLKGKRSLDLWLDFSATPKTQAGTYFPWIITDYPLAQAIEDQIVKALLIVHRVRKEDPDHVVTRNVVQAYHDWIAVALDRWRTHTEFYKDLGQKPVLFIMCERTSYADAIAAHIRKQTHLGEDEVLLIHTDTQGHLTKKYLDEARDAAREVDRPGSPVKIIVSVLMLREGWDVKNVTVVLGLRPFTSRAEILPEQAIGRGLRVMPNIGPDNRQTLEVIGTEAFEDFVRELEHEGVGIDTVSEPPPLPVKIYPMKERLNYDIAIPLTKPQYIHSYSNLGKLDSQQLDPIYETGVLAEEVAIEIEMAFATTDTLVHQTVITPDHPLLSQDFLRDMTQALAQRLCLDGRFAELYAIVKRYVSERCFGTSIDLESEDIKQRLRDPMLQEGIVAYLSREIANRVTERREIVFEDAAFHLSQTDPFTWRRKHLPLGKTIFSECAVFNNLEARFAEFLDNAKDISRFAALAESYTRFRVDYLSANGAIRFYYPDFVAVQRTPDGDVHWIIETKGREDENVKHKDAAIKGWCARITEQTGELWRYLKVPQKAFDKAVATTFAGLVKEFSGDPLGILRDPDVSETSDT